MSKASVVAPVQSMDEALAFWRDAMQCPVKFRDGERYCAIDVGGFTLGLLGLDERIVDAPALSLKTANLDEALQRATAHGAVVLQGAQAGPHEMRAVLRAPGDMLVVLTAPLVTPAS